MKKLFLHVGTHKTGTTSIQDFCATHRGKLLEQGLWYPNYERGDLTNAHHDFFKALVYGTNRLHGKCNQIVDYWHEESIALDAEIFVSAEPIFRMTSKSGTSYKDRQRKFLKDVKAILSRFEVIPVVVYREHSKFLGSLYCEQVANGGIDGYFDLLDYANSNINPLLRYSDFLESINQVFDEKTVCIKFEDLFADGSLVKNFFAKLGFQDKAFDADVSSRKSLTIPASRMKECINPTLRLQNGRKNRKVLDFLKSNQSNINASIKETFYSVGGYQLWASEERLTKFYEVIESDARRLDSLVDFSAWTPTKFNYNSIFLPPYELLNLNESMELFKRDIFKLVN